MTYTYTNENPYCEACRAENVGFRGCRSDTCTAEACTNQHDLSCPLPPVSLSPIQSTDRKILIHLIAFAANLNTIGVLLRAKLRSQDRRRILHVHCFPSLQPAKWMFAPIGILGGEFGRRECRLFVAHDGAFHDVCRWTGKESK